MKTLLCLVLVSAALAAPSATLLWNAPTNGPAWQGYRIYKSIPGSAEWDFVTAVATNEWKVLSQSWLAYRVTAFNVFGESEPSNSVTNNFVPPLPPSNMRAVITNVVESAASPAGPWRIEAELNAVVALPKLQEGKFYRSRLTIQP